MSDRIAVFDRGRIVQTGTPAEIYGSPANEFVAEFVGTSNLLRGEIAERWVGRPGTFSVRPEKIHLLGPAEVPPSGFVVARGEIADIVFAGVVSRYRVALEGGGGLVVVAQNLGLSVPGRRLERGAPVLLAWSPEHLSALSSN